MENEQVFVIVLSLYHFSFMDRSLEAVPTSTLVSVLGNLRHVDLKDAQLSSEQTRGVVVFNDKFWIKY